MVAERRFDRRTAFPGLQCEQRLIEAGGHHAARKETQVTTGCGRSRVVGQFFRECIEGFAGIQPGDKRIRLFQCTGLCRFVSIG